jgi:hypothetical protein
VVAATTLSRSEGVLLSNGHEVELPFMEMKINVEVIQTECH